MAVGAKPEPGRGISCDFQYMMICVMRQYILPDCMIDRVYDNDAKRSD